MKPGAEYAQSLPLDKEWYKNLDLGGMELPGSNGLDGPDMDHGEPPHTPPILKFASDGRVKPVHACMMFGMGCFVLYAMHHLSGSASIKTFQGFLEKIL